MLFALSGMFTNLDGVEPTTNYACICHMPVPLVTGDASNVSNASSAQKYIELSQGKPSSAGLEAQTALQSAADEAIDTRPACYSSNHGLVMHTIQAVLRRSHKKQSWPPHRHAHKHPHSLTHSRTHSPTHARTHLLTHSLMHACMPCSATKHRNQTKRVLSTSWGPMST